MIRRWWCGGLIAFGTVVAVRAQEQSVSSTLLDMLIARVERNYAGFRLEVERDADAKARYDAFTVELRQRAAKLDDAACLRLLRDYVGWFGDAHLFVQEYPSFSKQELAEFARTTPRRSTEGLVARLATGERDPIEGVWFTPSLEIAIAEDSAEGTFAAIILESRSEHWQPGEVIAEFQATRDGEYEATLRMDDHSPRHFATAIEKNLLLHMPPHTWGRRSPVADHERGLLNPVDPRAPQFRAFGPGACLISLPSFAGNHQRSLQKLCAEHAAEITARDLLILDLRGNEGGSSLASRPLAPFYFGDDRRPSIRPPGSPHVLSSPDTLAYYQEMKTGFFTPPWLSSLRRRLAAAPGELVPLYEGGRSHAEFVPRKRHEQPRHVAILIDEHVVSAGEAFVLDATRHAKVRTFGRNTSGTIDYQNVRMVLVQSGRHRFALGYPLIAASERLPDGGWNAQGIPPDVVLEADVRDPIGVVRTYYRQRK